MTTFKPTRRKMVMTKRYTLSPSWAIKRICQDVSIYQIHTTNSQRDIFTLLLTSHFDVAADRVCTER